MTLQESICKSMQALARRKNTVFLGENIINSGRIYGTLDRVSTKRCIEMPVAENLIAGTAIGLAIAGYHPICIFQRMDFMLIAADQIINHAALIPTMTSGIVKLPIIFRTIRADLNDKFYVGYQHSKDFTHIFERYVKVAQVNRYKGAEKIYQWAYKLQRPVLIVEQYNHYREEVKSNG